MRILIALLVSLTSVFLAAADPVKSPLGPEESLRHFALSPALDLRIDLVAAEPNVVDPVAVAFDENARMYVVEMRDYPNGPPTGQPTTSRIRLLEDADGDGRYESAHDFADGLLFATGVLPWDGGAIVTVAGEVRFLKDTDGDRKADVNEVWFSGFEQGNPQLRANHPTFGPDGWIYVANGLRGGKVKAVKSGWPETEVELRDHDFRFDPRTGKAEAVTGGSQFGLTFDAFGNRFICSNRNPCDHVVLEDSDLVRNPQLAIGKPTQVVVAAGDDSRVYPLVEAWTTSTLHAGQFTAACGVTVFTGDALPPGCVGNVFTCEPTGSLVHRERLEPVGGTFRGRPIEQRAEFLASHDPWFRPVNLTVGPDGALYVVDMYRAVIEHPEWVPDELKNRKDERWGDDRGRIYRVAAKDRPPGRMPTLANAAEEELFGSLDGANGWERETAARLLSARSGPASNALLAKLATDGGTPEGRARAAELLAGREELTDDLLSRLLDDGDPRVVAVAARAASPHAEAPAIAAKLLKLAESPDPRVRFEVARSVAEPGAGERLQLVNAARAAIVSRNPEDRWMRAAVLSAVRKPLPLFVTAMRLDPARLKPLLVEIADLVGRRREVADAAALIPLISPTTENREWTLAVWDGLGRGAGGTLDPVVATIAKPDLKSHVRKQLDDGLASVTKLATATAADRQCPAGLRIEAVRALGLTRPADAVPVLLRLATAEPDHAVRIAALAALARFKDEHIAPALMADFAAQTPDVRSAILDALLADPARAAAVVETVAAKELSPAELGPARIAALSRHPDPAVREKAANVFAPPADRQQVIAEYGPALSRPADAKHGREVFLKNCATCHRIGELGTQVGPDIADSRVRSPEALLTDILDPNRAIDGRYVAYTVALADGTVQTGLIAGETANAVTLAQPDGKSVTLLREQIDSIRSEGTSLMPVGVERTIPPQDMADLISFIKNWRYLDGAVPLAE